MYAEEQERLGNMGGGGGRGGAFDWLEIDKPADKGKKTFTRLRVLPRLRRLPDGTIDPQEPYHRRFWASAFQHRVSVVNSEGKEEAVTLNCPDDHAVKGHPVTCPVCQLRDALFATKNADYEKKAKDLYPKPRYFCNVIAPEQIQGHWAQVDGQWVGHPKVFGYSRTVQKGLIDVCTLKGPVEDVQVGREVVLVTERTGTRKFDIEYDVREGSDSQPIPQEWYPILYAGHDLEGLVRPASMEDLQAAARRADPRGARGSGGGYAGPGSYQPAGPPPGQWQPPPGGGGYGGGPPQQGGYQAPPPQWGPPPQQGGGYPPAQGGPTYPSQGPPGYQGAPQGGPGYPPQGPPPQAAPPPQRGPGYAPGGGYPSAGAPPQSPGYGPPPQQGPPPGPPEGWQQPPPQAQGWPPPGQQASPPQQGPGGWPQQPPPGNPPGGGQGGGQGGPPGGPSF